MILEGGSNQLLAGPPAMDTASGGTRPTAARPTLPNGCVGRVPRPAIAMDADPANRSGNRDLGADFVELLLDRLGLVLRHAFLDRLRRALDEILGFLRPEAGDFTDDLDDL